MEFSSLKMVGVERALDGVSLRHEAIAANIANLHTPGYVKQQVDFEQTLEAAVGELMGSQDGASVTPDAARIMSNWRPAKTLDPEGPQRLDGNETAIEQEMSRMAQNALKYNTLTTVVAKEYSLLKTIAQAR